MQKCVFISGDVRAAQQLRGWFRLFANQPYLEIHSSLKSFDDKYTESLKQRDLLIVDDSDGAIDDSPTGVAQRLEAEANLTPIRLLIIDLDSIATKPLEWLATTISQLRERGHITTQMGFKTLLLGYDDPHLRPDRFRHDAVDDMVIKPLDQQLFLQKVELLLADKPEINPTFIFRARAEGEIEIGKDATIDEVADFAISIRNPAPIAAGVFAQIHSKIFGATASSSRILGRCYASVRHPQFEGLWLVRFSLFGITNDQLAEVRKFIRSRQIPGRAKLSSSARKPLATPKNKLPPRYRVAVIDLDRDILSQAQTTIEENFDRTAVTAFPSYTRFLGGLAKLSGHAEAVTVVEDDHHTSSTSEGLPGGRITLVVADKEYDLLRFDPPLKTDEKFLGRDTEDWSHRPGDWITSIPTTDHEDFNEFLNYTAHGGRGVTGVRFVSTDGGFVYAEAKGSYIPANPAAEEPAMLRLELRQIEREAWHDLNRMMTKGVTVEQYKFDAVIIDGGLIRLDAPAWLEGLQGALVRAHVLTPKDPLPKIFVLADEKSRVEPSAFTHPGIADFIYKPLDRKLITDKLAAALPNFSRSVQPDGSLFIPCELTGQVCKTIELEELSEFGLTVLHPTPFKPRTFMRFFSKLLGESTDGVLARCTASIPLVGEDGFKCLFVFFGCSDELHKRIRNWIREDYVLKKETGV